MLFANYGYIQRERERERERERGFRSTDTFTYNASDYYNYKAKRVASIVRVN